jgi:hypothetical protein
MKHLESKGLLLYCIYGKDVSTEPEGVRAVCDWRKTRDVRTRYVPILVKVLYF